MRLVQAGAVMTVMSMLAFWFVMWRRGRAGSPPAGPQQGDERNVPVNAS
jgi:hypothetical protein